MTVHTLISKPFYKYKLREVCIRCKYCDKNH